MELREKEAVTSEFPPKARVRQGRWLTTMYLFHSTTGSLIGRSNDDEVID